MAALHNCIIPRCRQRSQKRHANNPWGSLEAFVRYTIPGHEKTGVGYIGDSQHRLHGAVLFSYTGVLGYQRFDRPLLRCRITMYPSRFPHKRSKRNKPRTRYEACLYKQLACPLGGLMAAVANKSNFICSNTKALTETGARDRSLHVSPYATKQCFHVELLKHIANKRREGPVGFIDMVILVCYCCC